MLRGDSNTIFHSTLFICKINVIMRRRRELDLKEDIKTEVKSVVGSLLFWLVKKLIDRLLQMLKDKGWVQLEDDTNGI